MRLLARVLPLVALCSACDGGAAKGGASSASAAATQAAPTSAPTAEKPKTLPPLAVDNLGIVVGSDRFNLAKDEAAPEKLTKAVKALTVDPAATVTVVAEKKARTPDVVRLFTELAAVGATKILVKTDGRDDLGKEVTFVPEAKVSGPPACSIAVAVLKDLETAVWNAKGTIAKKQRKGHAGPDLSLAGETMEKELERCDSDVAFVAADDAILWEMTFNLAATLVKADKKKKLQKIVLLKEAVAGRAVAGAK